MLVINMWFIKHTNGLYYYGLDYATALGDEVREIWVRNAELARAVRERLPTATVLVLTARSLPSELLRVRRLGYFMFTPSSHPLPLLRRQIVVVHDSFPFKGGAGAVKLLLFRLGLALSQGMAAYINCADGRAFLARCGLSEGRMRFLPNRIAGAIRNGEAAPLVVDERLVVGLFGSDSPKKNYDALFASFDARPRATEVIWRIYGHPNAYTDRLRTDYPDLAIEVVSSDHMKMEEFINSIDLAISVALGEGFARPIALALMHGVPTLLLDTAVFREFYAASAQLFATPGALANSLMSLRPGSRLERPRFAKEAELRADFDRAIMWLRSR